MKRALSISLVFTLCLLMATMGMAETFRQGGDRITFHHDATTTQTTAYTVLSTDSLVNVTCSSADIVITLPDISAMTSRPKSYKILKTDATAYRVIVTPATGDTIGGESTRYLTYQNAYMVISTGPNNDWQVEYESPYVAEDYEAGTVGLYAVPTFIGDLSIDGTTPNLTIGDADQEDAQITYDGNATDFHIGLDDTDDGLKIGVGSALGTDTRVTISNALTATTVIIGDAAAEDAQIRFDGNAQDFHIGLDDSVDDLVIGLGSTLGTTPAIAIDENQVVTLYQDPIFTGTTPNVTIGDAGEEDAQLSFDGNAKDFSIGLDDTTDDLTINVGTTLGTNTALSVDEDAVVTITNSVMYPFERATATNVLTAVECGKIFTLDSATEFATTLPAISTVSAGCSFTFIVDAAPSGAAYTVVTGNSLENVLIGGVHAADGEGGGTFVTAGDTITFVDGQAVPGDMVMMWSDGTNFFATGFANVTAGVTFTAAD